MQSRCNLHIPVVVDPRGQAEVPDLHDHVLCEKHVAQLQVAMNDLLLVHVGYSLGQLAHVVAYLRLSQRPAVFQYVHEALREEGGRVRPPQVLLQERITNNSNSWH